jgi:hypothetical protein
VSLLLLFRSQGSGGPAPPAPTLDNRGVTGNPTRGRTASASPAVVATPTSLLTSLVASYAFDGTVEDEHTGGLDWTNGTPDGYAAGLVYPQALLTDATAGTGSVLYREAAHVDDGPLSVECWVFPLAIQSGQGPAYLWTQAQDVSFFEQAVYLFKDAGDGNGVFVAHMASDAGESVFYLPGTPVAGQWWHLVMTSTPATATTATVRLYVNGVLRAEAEKLVHYVVNDVTVNRATAGGNWFLGPATPADACRLGPLRVWSKALSDGGVSVGQTAGGEVAMLYRSGAGRSLAAFTTYMMNRGVIGVAGKNSSVTGRPPN